MAEQLLVGAHVSAAGGIPFALDNITAIGGNVVQLFSASPRIWARKPIDPSIFATYLKKKDELGILTTVIHAIYLVNLASENPEAVQKSIGLLSYDMDIISKIKGTGVVVHVGSYGTRGFDAVKEQLVEAIHKVVISSPPDAVFLIENSAGQIGKVGSKLEEIQWLLSQLGKAQVGWCLDTCHAHAAGYRLAPGHGSPFSTEPFIFDEIERLNLWESLKVVHVNESRDPFFSHRDRHANLGEGEIGNEAMHNFLANEHIRKLPLILEVPGEEKTGPDAANIEKLKQLLQ